MAYESDAESILENEVVAFFTEHLGWSESKNCMKEEFGPSGTFGRPSDEIPYLPDRLRAALRRLNPHVSAEGLEQAYDILTEPRTLQSIEATNRELYALLREGIKVRVYEDDEEQDETVRVIDWDDLDANDWLIASQFWVSGSLGRKRPDIVGFVNGLPLLLIELKAAGKPVTHAYDHNISDYKRTIPQLFWFNAFIVLSNGIDSRIGTLTSGWEHFSEWKRVESEAEKGEVSIERLLRGTCERERFLDLCENFVLYSEESRGIAKLVAKNHQFLGVNNAIEAVEALDENQGKLGVFWHTQGSGKSYSMVFFSRKVLRKLPGDWTFVIVTDRVDLDDQIYGTFARTSTVTREDAQAESGEDLKRLLSENNRFVFTIINKFRTEADESYPVLSERSNIIVMTDEAHRSEYGIYARNMREALPNAAFIGFTGTPLIADDSELTREWFGDYVSVYDFKQAIDDGATVPLYYENRIPELELTNQNLNDDMERLLEEAALDPEQERKLDRMFSNEYGIITNSQRLEKIASDIVQHFMGRGHFGKAMVVSIDKPTAVKMYDQVQAHWQQMIADLEAKLPYAEGSSRESIETRLAFMRETDMAVVVSSEQNEIERFEKLGLDIEPHRRRMVKEELDEKFKDPDDRLRIVFVCAMWMTGFDAPSVSTIYLDKPMRNHTLMQTIARANRVWGEKQGGLIVDYIGVLRNLEEALSIYGSAPDGEAEEGEMPVKEKEALLEQLSAAIDETFTFLSECGVDADAIVQEEDYFKRLGLINEAYDHLLVNDETKRHYLTLARRVDRLFKTTLPSNDAQVFAGKRSVIVTLAGQVEQNQPEVDISAVVSEVESLLDESISARGYVINQPIERDEHLIDLSRLNIAALRERFSEGKKRTEAEKLRQQIIRATKKLISYNRQRIDYLERLEQLIADYNEGSANVDEYFERLIEMFGDLKEEEQRHIRENLTEEELAVFDLLVRPEIQLSDAERKQVKAIAKDLLDKLKREKLVLDWQNTDQKRAGVTVAIEETLDRLPDAYSTDVWRDTCDAVYRHFKEKYPNAQQNVYAYQSEMRG